VSGYIKAENKQDLKERMDRIEGQARGISRMIDREAYCIDILTQITSLIAASEKVATILLKDHLDHCVTEALESGEELSEKTEEVKAAIERFLRV
jgi:CsoR family transcriptional regulator, copper-sensing transcriptional repressor